MKFRVDLDPAAYPAGKPNPHVWIASVECDEPSPRVLLRNQTGNLEHCLEAIDSAITRHVLNPWSVPAGLP